MSVSQQATPAEPSSSKETIRVVLWGTYDTGKPRTRILRSALHAAGIETIEVHHDVWHGIEDKSQVRSALSRLRLLVSWLAAYPMLILKYLRATDHDVVLVSYPGQLDVLMLWPFARLRRKPIVWDAFLSLYDTVVLDRQMVRRRHPLARLIWGVEWLSCRTASRVVLDTEAHAGFFRRTYGIAKAKTDAVFVGAETKVFQNAPPQPQEPDDDIRILFYGQFIPLHGIATIVQAAQAARDRPWRWTVVGTGQEEALIRALIADGPQARLDWIPWVPYKQLASEIARADICLGIFGTSDKAARVIPNKAFQVLSAGKPLITRDSPAIRELVSEDDDGVYLVPPADPQALLEAVERFATERGTILGREVLLHERIRQRFSLDALGEEWTSLLQRTILVPTVR